MRPVVAQVDAELAILTWLRGALGSVAGPPAAAGAKFGTRWPAGKATAGPFVRIRRSGGTQLATFQDAARLDFQVRHDTDESRMSLALWLRSLLLAASGSVVDMGDGTVSTIGRVTEFVGPGRFPDPEIDGSELVMFTVEARLRGRAG